MLVTTKALLERESSGELFVWFVVHILSVCFVFMERKYIHIISRPEQLLKRMK